jgi:hypothetical protein
MYEELEPTGWQARKIRDWLLAIVRFAITLDETDRQTAHAIAQEMDGLGSLPGQSSFRYFVRTSANLCRAIADRDDPGRSGILRRHLAAIGDRRLRQATAAAIDLEGGQPVHLRAARLDARTRTAGPVAQRSTRAETR